MMPPSSIPYSFVPDQISSPRDLESKTYTPQPTGQPCRQASVSRPSFLNPQTPAGIWGRGVLRQAGFLLFTSLSDSQCLWLQCCEMMPALSLGPNPSASGLGGGWGSRLERETKGVQA